MSHATAQAPPIDRTSIALPFAAIVLAMLPAVLDQTILATALPTIARDLGALTDVSWVVTAYVVAAAATTPLWGKLGDRYGRKLLLEIALAMFVAASALCGAAQDITQLVALRARAGRGRRRADDARHGRRGRPRLAARARPLPGLHRATFAVATIVGPLLGGLLVEHASWRWVFYVNLPLGVAALVGLRARLPAPRPSARRAPLDVLGAALLAGATSALMLACIWGGDRYAWDSAPILALFAATVVAGGGALVRERRAADPIVPFDLLRTRAVAVASAGALPRHRGAVRGQRLRPAVPAGHDGRDARPRPACCSCPRCSASRSRRRCRAARSRAPGATSASRSPGWA